MLGSGILQGLAVTAKNFVGSYTDPARMVTVQYPEERAPIGENYRSFPFLVCEDAANPIQTLRCVACQICEKECPPQCIYIEKSKDKKPDATGKPQLYPVTFDIDTSVCMGCGICAELCPFDSIKMDKVFEVATSNRFEGLLVKRDQLAKSNAYYHGIRPTEAAEVDDRLAAERAAAEEKAKAAAAAKAAAPKPAPKPAAPVPVQAAVPAAPAPVAPPPKTAEAPSAEAPKPPTPAA